MYQAKKSHPLVLWMQEPHQKSAVVGFLIISAQEDQEVLSLDHQKGGSEFETLSRINTDNVTGE